MQNQGDDEDQKVEVRFMLDRKDALELLQQIARQDQFRDQLEKDLPEQRRLAVAAEDVGGIPEGALVDAIRLLRKDEPNAANRVSRYFQKILGPDLAARLIADESALVEEGQQQQRPAKQARRPATKDKEDYGRDSRAS